MTTSLLLHGEEANNSTNIYDSSHSWKTLTVYGNTKISTADFPYGKSSIYFDGSGDYLSVDSNFELLFTNKAFTIEAWIKFSNSGTGMIFGIWGSSCSYMLFCNNSSGLGFSYSTSGSYQAANEFSVACSTNTWHHVAVSRLSTGDFLLFVDGVMTSVKGANSDVLYNNSGLVPNVGGNDYSQWFSGYIKDLRVTYGKALYTSTFTPPQILDIGVFLQFNGTLGSTSLIDSFSIPKTVTAFGNAQISTHQYIYGISSLALDGTGDYVHISDHPDLNFGAENFTVEFWIFPRTVSTTQVLINKRTVAGYCEIFFYLANNIPSLYISSDASSWVINNLSSSIPVLVSRWTHLAVVRNGSNFTIYVNGFSGASATFAGTLLTNAEPLVIGNDYSGSPFVNFNGYFKDVRVIKGNALYTASFTPPSAIPNEYSLLLNFEGSHNSTTIVDESASPKTITAYGGAIISTTNKRIGTSSLYVNGTDSYLRSPPSSDFSFGSGKFTIEGWYNSSLVASEYGSLCGVWGVSGYRSWNVYIGGPGWSGGQLWFYWSTNGSSYSSITFNTTHEANVWKHFAFVRTENLLSLFINGIIVGSPQALSDTFNNSTQQDLTIGASSTAGGEYFKGYIDQLKITKGESLYGKNFFLNDAVTNYSLLLNFDGPDGSTTIIDSSPSPKTITVQGNAQLSSTEHKFNSTSLFLGGSGDYITTPTSSDLQFGTSDFTIEGWVFPLSFANAPNLFSQRDGSSGVTLRISGGGVIVFFGPGLNSLSQFGTINLNEWTHIALVRNGASFNSYINGVFSGTNDLGTGYSLSYNNPTWIGGASGYNEYINGYIGQLKVVKELAKYTYNFSLVEPGPAFLYFYDIFNDYFSSFISYYPLADESGTTLSDKISSFPLTLSADTVTYQDASLVPDYDFSMTFSGQSASGTFIDLNGYKEFSLGFVLKTSSSSQTVISKSGVFSVQIDSSGFILWTVNSDSLLGTISVSDNVSHYVICSYNEGGLFLSVDGVNDGYLLPHGLTVTDVGTQPLIIGTFTGTLDEVFILSSFMNYPRSNFYYDLLTNNISSYKYKKTSNSWFFDEGAPPGNYLDYCFFEPSSKNVLDCEYSADIITTNPIVYTRATFVPINGYVTVEGIPSSRQVFLLEWYNKRIVRTTWSDPSTGYYEFTDVKAGYYFIWCPDHLETFRPMSSLRISNF